MIIKNLKNLKPENWGNGESSRFLLKEDRMGFSVTHTTVNAGSESKMEYKKHLEACYCIEGEGEIEDEKGDKYPISKGKLYALDKHDKHTLRAKTKMTLICFFIPALKGDEKHKLSDSGYSNY